MTKVLLTGGSGFIAAHILEQLLEKGHSVITTVRSEDKAAQIRDAHKDKADRLQVEIVPDIAQPDAFDEVVKTPGIEVVLHTASPFHFRAKDPKTELVDPAVNGTTGILRAIQRSGSPSVRRVVVTSSFAAILDASKFTDPSTTFTEDSWNPIGLESIHRDNATAYRASKVLAERAAWDFVRGAAAVGFDLATVAPPLVFGPVAHHLAGLDAINTSNERVVALLRGAWKEGIPPVTPVPLWVDVRDVARAHIRAFEEPAAGGQRLFVAAGCFSNREVADIAWSRFPEFRDRLPGPEIKGGELPPEDQLFKFDNDRTKKLLAFEWTSLEQSITDLITSLKAHGD